MKICYINFKLDNPRDQITLRGLRENGLEIIEIADNAPGWKKYWRIVKAVRERRGTFDYLVVGYMGGMLVVLLRVLTGERVVYNALCSFYDGMILSRFGGRRFSFAAVGYYLLDWLAFHAASHSFVETKAQKASIERLYGIPGRKLSVHYLGADDREFFYDSTVLKRTQFTAVFRGMFLPEGGADVAVRAAKELEEDGIAIRLLGRGLLLPEIESLIAELKPANLEFISARLPIEELRHIMLECHVSLGQLADHPRLNTTIPHKAFESMSMQLPYLTGANRGVLEILSDNETCFTFAPGDHYALAAKLRELKGRPVDLAHVAENAHALYQNNFTSKALAANILTTLTNV